MTAGKRLNVEKPVGVENFLNFIAYTDIVNAMNYNIWAAFLKICKLFEPFALDPYSCWHSSFGTGI